MGLAAGRKMRVPLDQANVAMQMDGNSAALRSIPAGDDQVSQEKKI